MACPVQTLRVAQLAVKETKVKCVKTLSQYISHAGQQFNIYLWPVSCSLHLLSAKKVTIDNVAFPVPY